MKAIAASLLILAAFASSMAQSWPQLPAKFTTSRGTDIRDGKILDVTDKGVKIAHSAGISLLAPGDLPADIQKSFGIETSGSDLLPPLPSPFTAGETKFQQAKITAIEPDGIRIAHANGTAKLGYEVLSASLQSALGGFDESHAKAFRDAEAERQKLALKQIAEAREHERQVNLAGAKQSAGEDDETKALKADPNKLSSIVQVALKAGSSGGKNIDTTWKTYYGSYNKEAVSARRVTCSIFSTARKPQRTRVQIIAITRSFETNKQETEIVADALVTLGGNGSAVIAGDLRVESTDDKYVALGIRERTGNRYLGWTCRAIDAAGRVSAVVSSTPGYDRFGWTAPFQ